MNLKSFLPLLLLAGVAACDKPHSQLFAERSISMIATPASAADAPGFAGRWAASTADCKNPWIIEARSLKHDDVICEFSKVETSSAGYSMGSTCTVKGGLMPGRLDIMLPDPARITTMTLSGGPFSVATALQRCPA
jgi:hypothetical protein